MQTRVFSSAADADVFLREEDAAASLRRLRLSALILRSVVVVFAVLVAVSISERRSASHLTHALPDRPMEVPQ
jgi:hypothetical protein